MKKLLPLLILTALSAMTSCKEKNRAENPFFTEWQTPFGVPPFDQIKPEHYKPAFEKAMELHNAEIDSIVANEAAPSFDNVILALDNSGEMLSTVSRVFFLLCEADTNPEMQAIEEDLSPVLAAHSDGIMLNDALFAKVKAVYDNPAAMAGDSMKLRLTEKTYKGFVRAGALLDQERKNKLKTINEQLSAATIKFSNNLLADNGGFEMVIETEEELAGLPPTIISAAAEAAKEKGYAENKCLFTLAKPSLIPFITYSSNRDLRQKIYEGYLNRCNHGDQNDNKQVINDIIRLRTEKARMLGFDSWAAYVLDEQMAKTTANVYDLLDALWTPSLASAKRELVEMKALMAADGLDPEDFQSWDWWYYAEKVRKQKYELDEEMLRPYFSLENVRTGIFALANRLFGVTFRPVTVPVYNKECVVYEALDRDMSHLGLIYFDFHPRAGAKGGGAWCDEFRSQSYKNGVKVAPIVNIVCNFTRPVGSQPALLNLDEAETLFHEFGHGLHALFADVPYKGLGGVERDFVELPSQILENWAFEPAMLRQYATHYATGAIIPDYLIEKIRNSSLFNQGFITTEFLAAAISDMDIHSTAEYKPIDVNAFEKESLNVRRGLIEQIAPRYRYPYFSHIFDGGYSAGYYSYIWSEVLDKDAYEAFVETGDIFNPDVAAAFRREILSKGGSADGMELYHNFRGKAPSREPLLKARGLL